MAGLPFTLRQLEIFEHLCDSRSFRNTSEVLGISQAAVSNQIKALEDQLGLKLLLRDAGRRPQLTAEGVSFLADLVPFRNAANALASHRSNVPLKRKQAPPAPLRLLIGPQLLEDFVRPALGAFLTAHPDIQLIIDTEAAFDSPRQALGRGNYDIGLFSERVENPLGDNLSGMSGVICGVFGHQGFLQGREAPLSVKEIARLPFVLPPAGSFHESEVLLMLAQKGIAPTNILGRTQYHEVMLAMCETGAAVGVSLQTLLKPDQSKIVKMLHRLGDWRLTLYRNPSSPAAQADAVVRFLTETVVDNPAYPQFSERG